MRHVWVSYILSMFLGFILLGLSFWIIGPTIRSRNPRIVSPLPDFLTLFANDQVSTTNLFLPKVETIAASTIEPPRIEAKSALVFNLSNSELLFAKNINDKLPMASLTKIMTAVIALENKREDDKYLVTSQELVGEDSMGLTPGEVLSLEELLYGLILPSGNDATAVLAANYPKGRDGFVLAMNNKARALGLSDTNFTNPSGLQGDGNQYTTAYDLLIITNYTLSHFPLFRTVAQTPYYVVPYTQTHKEFYLENETNLLSSYPGVKGVKTGYTPEAGLCLVTYLEYKGQKIVAVLLGSNNRRQEMKDLLDYSLKTLGIPPPPHI